MKPIEIDFWKSLTDTYWQAYWGEGYDLDLIDVILRLSEAEDGIVWQDIKGGAAVWEWDEYCNPERADMLLESARAEDWSARKRLARDHTPDEVDKIFSAHRERINDHRVYGRPENIETTIIAQVVGFLTRADQSIPSVSRVADLIEGIKASTDPKRNGTDAIFPLLNTIEQLEDAGFDQEELVLDFQELARRIHKEQLFQCNKFKTQEKIRQGIYI